jgi:hypothetical protein
MSFVLSFVAKKLSFGLLTSVVIVLACFTVYHRLRIRIKIININYGNPEPELVHATGCKKQTLKKY